MVRDTLPVLEHILTFAGEEDRPQVHLLMAFHHEKVTRNYVEANNCFVAGGVQLKDHLAAFEQRMSERKMREFKDVLDDDLSSNFSKKRMRPSDQDENASRLKKLKIEDGSAQAVVLQQSNSPN